MSIRLTRISKEPRAWLTLLWFGVLVILAGLLVGNFKAYDYYRATERRAFASESAVAGNALADHARQLMRQVDTILRGTQTYYLRSQSIAEVRSYISDLTIDEELFSGIYIADRNGQVAWVHDDTETRFSVTDRPYFAEHRDDPGSGLIISPVVIGRATNTFNFHVSRRLNNADGSFAGLVIITVNPNAFVDYMRELTNRPSASMISLFETSDHKLRFRIPVPRPSQWDQPIKSELWSLLQSNSHGFFESESPIDGIARSLYYKSVTDYPLVALSGFSDSDLAGAALDRSRWVIFVSIALTAVILSLAALASSAVSRGARLSHAKAELESLYREMERLAMIDSLTGLPGRTMFMERLAQAIALARREHTFVAVLFLDLDGFKTINDTFGHSAGDEVLKTVALRWSSCVREIDTVARLGGDEYAVVLCNLETPEDALPVAEKLICQSQSPIPLSGGKQCVVGVSIGLSVFPKNALQIDSLVTAADDAMYKSKAAGKNRVTVSDAICLGHDDHDTLIECFESMDVGNGVVDAEHQRLNNAISAFNQAVRDGAPLATLNTHFDEILKLFTRNSESEDALMLAKEYPQRDQHHGEHVRLIRELERAHARFGKGGEFLAIQKIREWLIVHHRSDADLGSHLNGKAAGAPH